VNRRARHGAILRLIKARAISTQAELAEALRAEGFTAVQATVSRDVAELGLVKVRSTDGRLVYAPPGPDPGERGRALAAAVRRYALSLEATGPLVVIVTPSGHANALAQAIDQAEHPAVAGTVAGDNTIFVAAREGTTAAALRNELAGHLLEGAA
jgi:transcriptional regulator of arginine metabolism